MRDRTRKLNTEGTRTLPKLKPQTEPQSSVVGVYPNTLPGDEGKAPFYYLLPVKFFDHLPLKGKYQLRLNSQSYKIKTFKGMISLSALT